MSSHEWRLDELTMMKGIWRVNDIPVARAEYICSCVSDPRDCKSFGEKGAKSLGQLFVFWFVFYLVN